MSHYAVGVLVHKIEDLDNALKPYDENMVVPVYIEETKEEIIKRVRKEIKEYAESGAYAQWKQNPIKYESECNNKNHIEYLKNEFPKKLNWTDEECYQDEIKWHEADQLDENGSVLSTYNPNSKWDWHVIGGRWKNKILVQEDCKDYVIGESSWFNQDERIEEVPKGYRWCDGAKVSDIQFEKIEELSNQSYEKELRFWEIVVDGDELKEGEEQPHNLYKVEYYLKRYKDKETYAKLSSSFKTYALLCDGIWYEKGEMGWFGCDNATLNSELAYLDKFNEVISNPINQDKYFIIVDCHI